MTMYSDNYYIMTEGKNEQLNCLLSYTNLEETKLHAKTISEQLNITCLIVKPVAKLISNTQWVIEDLQKE